MDASGFSSFTQKGITLQADQSVTDDIKLQLASTAQTINVQATAAMVDTTTATLSQVVTGRQIVELPLNGRNAASLTMLVAGASPTPAAGGGALQGITKEFPSQIAVSTSGTQEDQVSYLLDGAPFNDIEYSVNMPFPFPDSLEEFSVQTSNYTAQYGNNSGGVVNVVTKSGTDDVHGNLFEFNRNPILEARISSPPAATSSSRISLAAYWEGLSSSPESTMGRVAPSFSSAIRELELETTAAHPTSTSPPRRSWRMETFPPI